jgi:hypothetical protein
MKTDLIESKHPAVAATGHIHIRTTMKRKSAYVRAASPKKLTDWIFENLDKASGYDGSSCAPTTLDQIRRGGRIVYNDGRPGHQGTAAVVLAVDGLGMTVQFEDRADSTYIRFSDRAWTDFIQLGTSHQPCSCSAKHQ